MKLSLDALPDDTVLEPVDVAVDSLELAQVQRRIKDAEDEVKALRALPVPSADIRQRVEHYVRSMGRPTVSGIDSSTLYVNWPSSSAISLLAVVMPDRVTEVILAEVERMANERGPPPNAVRASRKSRRTSRSCSGRR